MSPRSLAFLGRQPEISLAELDATASAGSILNHDSQVALLSGMPATPDRLGGTVKLAEIFATTDSAAAIEPLLKRYFLDVGKQQSGKITLGISSYSASLSAGRVKALGSLLKKSLREEGRNTRLVFNNNSPLSPAQIFHNRLLGGNRFEICVWQSKGKIYLARTNWVQNIEAYSRRDMTRRKNLRAGILPPKLAQVMLNLTRPAPESTILDPFCGNGGLLQEALLSGCKVLGSDIDQNQLEICAANLRAFTETWRINQDQLLDLSVADATSHKWLYKIDGVASEIDLGPPLGKPASVKYIEPHRQRAAELLRKSLANLTKQLEAGSRLCLAVPAWPQKDGGYLKLDPVACSAGLGYSLENQDLIYCRPNQFVGRQLLILERV